MTVFFFFKQKTAYEMRISDWSSDVCSSDLAFHIKERNRVLYLANNVVAQSGELTTKGVEFEASYTLPGNFELLANYGYNQLRSEVNSSPDYMPRHIASIWSPKTFRLAAEATMPLAAGLVYSGQGKSTGPLATFR